jgi:hypothetical protein
MGGSLMRIALFCALVAGMAAAQSRPGAIVAEGNVRVDGKQVQRTGNIFPGEKLESARDGSANITSDGAVASVKGAAKLTYGENAIDLDCGQVRVATIHEFEVRAHGINVTPTSARKTEMVTEQAERSLKVSAVEGSVNVVKDNITTLVNAGESKQFDDGAHCRDPLAAWVPGYLWVGSWVPFIPDSDNDHDRDDISTSKPD